MKKLFILILVGFTLILSGCGIQEGSIDPDRPYPPTHYGFIQNLPDGRNVLCVWVRDSYAGGLSCDWSGAR